MIMTESEGIYALENIFSFIINSVLLGFGLAMDAFSVSVADGMSGKLGRVKRISIAGVFGFFQFLMPLAGWLILRLAEEQFHIVYKFVPYAALIILTYLGVKMIAGCIKNKNNETEGIKSLSPAVILMQGISTSLDALSVGLTTSGYTFMPALLSSLIIGAVTFALCVIGILLGRKIGDKLKGAEIAGGIVLILIGIEIFVKNVFFG